MEKKFYKENFNSSVQMIANEDSINICVNEKMDYCELSWASYDLPKKDISELITYLQGVLNETKEG